MPGRPRGQLTLFKKDQIIDPKFCEVISDTGPNHATTNDDDSSRGRKSSCHMATVVDALQAAKRRS